MSTQSLEDRLQRLEDLEAIRDLVYRWTFYVNKGWNGNEVDIDAMSLVYTEDASGGMPQMNSSVEGLQQIKSTLKADTADIKVSVHTMLNPVIDLDGDTAKANWVMQIYVVRDAGTRQLYMSAEHTYLRTARGWRIKTVRMYVAGMIQT